MTTPLGLCRRSVWVLNRFTTLFEGVRWSYPTPDSVDDVSYTEVTNLSLRSRLPVVRIQKFGGFS